MKINYSGSIINSKVELAHLKNAIDAATAASLSLGFDTIDSNEFLTKYDAFIVTDAVYYQARKDAQMYNQQKVKHYVELRKVCWEIAKFLRIKYSDNTKKLGLWGITLVYGKEGVVRIDGKYAAIESLTTQILAKDTADAANSLITSFNTAHIQAVLSDYQTANTNFEAEQVKWRSLSVSRRGLLLELKSMQRKIAQEMLSTPNFNPRLLEDWGYTITEFHEIKTLPNAA